MKTPRETAIQWFLRLQHMEPDHPDRSKFEAWLIADVAHQNAYLQVETLWSKLDSPAEIDQLTRALDAQSQQQLLDQHLSQQSVFTPKRIKPTASLISLLLLLVVGLFGYRTWQAQPVMQMIASTEIGRVQSQILDDGSKIVLNAHSDVEVIYYRNQRTVNLKRGEAIFEVVPDADRPFVVDSGKAKVTVLGTRFAVNRFKQFVRISVDHGRVQVNANQPDNKENIVLTDGQVAEVQGLQDNGAQQTPYLTAKLTSKRVDRLASDAFSFENGFIMFRDADLDEIAETLTRYRKTPVEVSNKGNNKAHVTASIKANQIEKFIGSLPDIAPVVIKSAADQTILQTVSTP